MPLKILKQPTDKSTEYDFPNGPDKVEVVADRAHTTQSPGKRMRITKKNSSGNNTG